MEILKDYTPAFYEPVLPSETEQEVLNEDTDMTQEEAQKFMAENFTAFNEKYTATRKMDDHEIEVIWTKAKDILENELPAQEEKVFEADNKLEVAKKEAKANVDLYKALELQVKDLARTAKNATKEHEFGAHELWKVPVGKQYRYYALIEGKLTLVGVRDIPSWEERDLLNAMNNNLEKYQALRDGASLAVNE